jgi:uncharacterized protein (UPF0335 family)
MRAIKACNKGSEQSSTQSFIKRLESLEEENLYLKQSLQEIKAQLNLSKE